MTPPPPVPDVPQRGSVTSSGIVIAGGNDVRDAVDEYFKNAHARSDVDVDKFALHHTLGTSPYQAAAGNHKHTFDAIIGGGSFNYVGPFSGAGPGGSTVGNAFTVEVAGTYLFTAQASGFSTVANLQTFTSWIDGSIKATRPFFFNVINVHNEGPELTWTQFLSAGTHYYWGQFSGSSDANDVASVTWTRIGNLSGNAPTLVTNPSDTGWIEVLGGVGFQNAWVNYDSRTARFRRINGIVYTEGIVKSGVVGPTIFQYPVGFRCTNRTSGGNQDKFLPAISNGVLGVLTNRGADGAVSLNIGNNTYVDLSAIPPFPADN